jgi:hypothetical protein
LPTQLPVATALFGAKKNGCIQRNSHLHDIYHVASASDGRPGGVGNAVGAGVNDTLVCERWRAALQGHRILGACHAHRNERTGSGTTGVDRVMTFCFSLPVTRWCRTEQPSRMHTIPDTWVGGRCLGLGLSARVYGVRVGCVVHHSI